MKKKICLLFVLVFVLACLPQFSVSASEIMPRNNNTLMTNTTFVIYDGGDAAVGIRFEGYPSITTGATISVKIEKRNLLIFWKDIVETTITVQGSSYFNELDYYLEKTGTYRCTVVYTVSGLGGEDDVITFQDTATYK